MFFENLTMKKILNLIFFSFVCLASGVYAAPSLSMPTKFVPTPEKDYRIMAAPQPLGDDVSSGKVQVTEFFWYGCPHCYAFEPLLEKWLARHKRDIVFKRVPVAFESDYLPHSKMYHTLVALGVEKKMTPKIFDEIQKNQDYLLSEQKQADFLAKQGIDPEKYKKVYESFDVNMAVKRDEDKRASYAINGVPTVVIQGKYITGPGMARSLQKTIKVMTYLVDQIRAKKM